MRDTPHERRHAEPARGILREEHAHGRKQGVRLVPPAALSPYVHHFWSIEWALRRALLAEGLPYPTVRVVFVESAGASSIEITGPRTGRFTKRLAGEGRVFGFAFRPAAFAPLFGRDVALLTDRVLPIGAVFGEEGDAWAAAICAEPDLDRRVALTAAFLAPRLPPLPFEVRRIRDLVERMAKDRSLRRVEDVCEASGLDLRALQRRFRCFVGVSPKWALTGFRMHEAVERLKADDPPPLAELAASLEYADQSHFSRDFKRRVGVTPQRFVERIRASRSRAEPALA